MFGGECSGAGWVYDYFEENRYAFRSECEDCWYKINSEADCSLQCSVADGAEPPMKCPALAEFTRFEGIKVYPGDTR